MLATDPAEILRSSEKFLAWKRPVQQRPAYDGEYSNFTAEKHFSPDELAEIWGVSVETVRQIFRTEPGVLKIGDPTGSRHKRAYLTLRIPLSVVERVHKKLSA